jgi:DOPA 4,5-dioxygenase
MDGPAGTIRGYHAHVYFRDEAERARALSLLEGIGERFPQATLGRVHEKPVVLHPEPMVQVAFPPGVFAGIVPWLMLTRAGLSILVHPLAGDEVAEHRDWSLWLGDALPLRLDRLSPERTPPRRRP